MTAALNSPADYIKACKTIEQSPKDFLEGYVAEDVNWTVTEPTGISTPIAGIYTSREAFMEGALAPLGKYFSTPLQMKVVDVIVAEKDEAELTKVCLELQGTGTLKDGEKPWKNYYSWVLHFYQGKAVVVRAYLDSAAVNVAMKYMRE